MRRWFHQYQTETESYRLLNQSHRACTKGINITLSLLAGDFCLLITFANSLDADTTSVLIWIQTVRHSDSVPEIFF